VVADAVEQHGGDRRDGPATPGSIIATAIAAIGVVVVTTASATRPAARSTSPLVITERAPNRSASRALSGVSTAPVTVIGRNTMPVASGERPRSCCRYRLITNGRP
jgi:hypothetical protein